MSDSTPGSRSESAEERPRVLVFFDYACPFCYLDWPRFERLRVEHDAEIVLCPFELRPELPVAGVSASALGGGHSKRVQDHMMRMAMEGGLCFEDRDFVPNSHLALALGEAARDEGEEKHRQTHLAIYRANYCDGLDIGDMTVVLGLAEECGLDAAFVRDALETGAYDERLHEFRHLAMAIGVSATPSALVCNELMIGSRPYAMLADSLTRCVERPHRHESGLVEERLDREDEGEPATVRGS